MRERTRGRSSFAWRSAVFLFIGGLLFLYTGISEFLFAAVPSLIFAAIAATAAALRFVEWLAKRAAAPKTESEEPLTPRFNRRERLQRQTAP